MKIKKEVIKTKPSIKDYKRMARDMYSIVPTKIHKNKKKYNRAKAKKDWKNQILEEWEIDYA